MNKLPPLDPKIHKDINFTRLERWIGAEKIEKLQLSMRGWYADPIYLADVPGGVWIHADGSFTGTFNQGFFASAYDYLEDFYKSLRQKSNYENYLNQMATLNVGFPDISTVMSRASQGLIQEAGMQKVGSSGLVGTSNSLWRVGNQPASGALGAAAPGGTVNTSASTGAFKYVNPASGTNHLAFADIGATISGNSLLIYDRLFSVLCNTNTTAAQAVTGVPTRYQSTTNTDPDYIGGNFCFPEVGGTALAATAHNWASCAYLDQANAASTLPTLTGVSGAGVDRMDMSGTNWFAPLASGDVGIKALTNMQLSAAVATGALDWVIGHKLGIAVFPQANGAYPFDWIRARPAAPRIFDNACIAFIEMMKPATTATTYSGTISIINAAP